jgi:2-oxoisovalerate ferredoxin oxidoreductase beta subunit
MSEFRIIQQKARSFYDLYERKAAEQHMTHYCPGCGHGVAHKLLARAIDELGIQDRVVLINPVGCSVFAYYYLDVGNIQAAHGRAPAVATAVKRSRPEAIVVSYQGDGDLAAIGSAEILHTANRGEPVTVIFINNAIYGMTGGQMAPTTPLGAKSTTSPYGRSVWSEGYPLHISEALSSLEAPVYIERVALGNPKQILQAARAIRKALEVQMKGLGFSLIEVLSPCPTIWKKTPVEAQRWVREELAKVYPLGVLRDRTATAEPRPAAPAEPSRAELYERLELNDTHAGGPGAQGAQQAAPMARVSPAEGAERSRLATRGAMPAPAAQPRAADWRIKIAGFGGQGVLMLGEVLAEAGLAAGLEVSWLPSYGPEMRSGTSNCHVRLSSVPIDSPLISKPNVLIALNEPSLRKFIHSVEPGGYVLYNAEEPPEGCRRADLQMIVRPFVKIADEAGDARCGNMVALGALLEAAGVLDGACIDAALRRKVKSARWLDLDRKALAAGRAAVHEPILEEVCDESL